MKKFLVVDDSFTNRQLLMEILADQAVCDEAASVEDAIAAYNSARDQKPYDLILLDIAMPNMNGVECLRGIRKHECSSDHKTPIIMVTAFKEFCDESFKEGCDDFVLKPVKAGELLKKIEKVLNK